MSDSWFIPRRRFVAATGLGLAGLASPVGAFACGGRGQPLDRLPPENSLAFTVLLEGEDPMGEHRWRFRPEGDRVTVDIDVDLEVKIAFVTVFNYEHQNRVEWRRGQMVSMESETLDNGNEDRCKVERRDGKLWIDGRDEPYTADPKLMPATYWRQRTVLCNQLLNTQTGQLVEIGFSRDKKEEVETEIGTFQARKWKMRGDVDIDLWYTDEGDLVRVAFTRQGRRIVYRLKEGGRGRTFRWG